MASTFSKHSVSSELAHRLIAAAERHANQMGHAFVIAIVDESGVLKALSRMDGAPLLSVQVAQDKSWEGGTTEGSASRRTLEVADPPQVPMPYGRHRGMKMPPKHPPRDLFS